MPVDFTTAQWAHDLGFDERTDTWYNADGNRFSTNASGKPPRSYWAPHPVDLLEWLEREKGWLIQWVCGSDKKKRWRAEYLAKSKEWCEANGFHEDHIDEVHGDFRDNPWVLHTDTAADLLAAIRQRMQ